MLNYNERSRIVVKYKEFIDNIIKTRGQWNVPKGEYWEGHHIIPRCMGGEGKNRSKHSNIIRLTAQEHYEAHKLLALENPNNKGIVFAFWRMSTTRSKNRKKYLTISAQDYEISKLLLKKLNIQKTPESNLKRSNTMKLHRLKWFTNDLEEIRSTECPKDWHNGRSNKIKIIISEKNKINSASRSCKGGKNGMFGKKQTEESNKKRSILLSSRHWFNNGKIECFEQSCPKGFEGGRLKKKISVSIKQKINKKRIPWNKGIKLTDEQKKNNKSHWKPGHITHNKNKIWINNNIKNKAINKVELDSYITAGWIFGMKPRKKKINE